VNQSKSLPAERGISLPDLDIEPGWPLSRQILRGLSDQPRKSLEQPPEPGPGQVEPRTALVRSGRVAAVAGQK
jgi:hypothetical protein